MARNRSVGKLSRSQKLRARDQAVLLAGEAVVEADGLVTPAPLKRSKASPSADIVDDILGASVDVAKVRHLLCHGGGTLRLDVQRSNSPWRSVSFTCASLVVHP